MTYTLTVPELRRLTALILSTDAGDAPCSRYGTYAAHWAPYAAAATYLQSSTHAANPDLYLTDDDYLGYGSVLSSVVNDSAGPAFIILEERHHLSRGVIAELGGIRHLRSLIAD